MSSAGRAANSSGCVARPKEHATGLIGFAAQIRRSSLIGSCAMEAAEHREPCESRGSCMDLGAPGGEIPPGDSTNSSLDPASPLSPLHLGEPTFRRRAERDRFRAPRSLRGGRRNSGPRRDVLAVQGGEQPVGFAPSLGVPLALGGPLPSTLHFGTQARTILTGLA